MPHIKQLPISDLTLDLHNYRTVSQKSEEKSLHALVSMNPDYFWALTESLLDDGWHGTENVLLLEKDGEKGDPRGSILYLLNFITGRPSIHSQFT